ncbi:MAG: alpha/beta fold hydrolase [Cyanobacteria bacterium P01_F01_bin.150]
MSDPTQHIGTNGITIGARVQGSGPLVILVHGFPELWYSWRHQIEPSANAGFKVVAIDVRGYGNSDKPATIDAYDMVELTGDIIGPNSFPIWLSEQDFDYYTQAFSKSGFRGPLNRYRAQQRDWDILPQLSELMIDPPSYFIAGSLDLVRYLVPEMDLYEHPGASCTDFRGKTIIDGKGHWIQQEAPEKVNKALLDFLSSISVDNCEI